MTSRLRELKASHPSRVIEIRYEQLVSSPLEALTHIYQRLGISNSLEESFETRIQNYLCKHPAGKHGKHHYTMEDFGLTKNRVRQELAEYYQEHNLLD